MPAGLVVFGRLFLLKRSNSICSNGDNSTIASSLMRIHYKVIKKSLIYSGLKFSLRLPGEEPFISELEWGLDSAAIFLLAASNENRANSHFRTFWFLVVQFIMVSNTDESRIFIRFADIIQFWAPWSSIRRKYSCNSIGNPTILSYCLLTKIHTYR